MKAEPRTILRFLLEYFDSVKDLYDAQTKDNIITFEAMNEITAKHKSDVKIQLLEYKIIAGSNRKPASTE